MRLCDTSGIGWRIFDIYEYLLVRDNCGLYWRFTPRVYGLYDMKRLKRLIGLQLRLCSLLVWLHDPPTKEVFTYMSLV